MLHCYPRMKNNSLVLTLRFNRKKNQKNPSRGCFLCSDEHGTPLKR